MPTLSFEQLQVFLLVIMPGIVALKVYDLLHPPQKRDFGSSLLEAATYGIINFALWSWLIVGVYDKDYAVQYPVLCSLAALLVLVASPAGLACISYYVRTRRWVCKRLGYANHSAWDDFFKRQYECWIIFHLKTGERLGAYFGPDSYVTTYPDEPEIYVETAYRVDENGKFLEIVPGSFGMIVKQSECKFVEFLKVEANEAPTTQGIVAGHAPDRWRFLRAGLSIFRRDNLSNAFKYLEALSERLSRQPHRRTTHKSVNGTRGVCTDGEKER